MALKHPTLDPLMAEFQSVSSAISFLNRVPVTVEQREIAAAGRANHPLLQNITDEKALLAELIERRNTLDAQIAEVAKKVRAEQNEAQRLAAMAAAEEKYGMLSDEQLVEVTTAAVAEAEAAQAVLRSLMLEAARRRGEAKAAKQIADLSPQAKAMFRKLAVENVPAQTVVNAPG